MDEHKVTKEYDLLRKEVDIEKIDQVARFSRIISLLIIPVLFILFTYGAIRLNNLYKELNSLEILKQAEQLKIEALKFENSTLEKKKSELEKKKVQLESELMSTYGLSIDSLTSLSSSQILDKSISSNDAIKDLIKTHTPNHDVTIRYYKKTIDEKRIVLELEALGYEFQEKSPSGYMSKRETNAIWFGANVSLNDVKIVALALLRAGIPLKGIRPFRSSVSNPDYKKNIVEVGASADLDIKGVLSVESIKDAKEFNR